jgi:ABC-type dipeptide/oligopeptide/nickel transport system ATPase subunit
VTGVQDAPSSPVRHEQDRTTGGVTQRTVPGHVATLVPSWARASVVGGRRAFTTKVGLLSGGQRQAITLLMAVFRKPQVLLLDEHTAALDPRASREIMRLTRSLVRDYRLTTLTVSHNLAHALDIGQRAVVMNRDKSQQISMRKTCQP